MSDKIATIVTALLALDTANDQHWTTDGLPRLETVKFLAKDQSLTRDEVTAASPGFNRSNNEVNAPAVEPVQEEPASVEPVQEEVEPAQAGAEVGEADFPAGQDAQAEQPEVENGWAANDPDALSVLQADLEEAEAVIADLMVAKDELAAAIDNANARADGIRDQLTTAKGPSDHSTVIQQALEAQKRQAEERGSVQRAIAAAGVDVKALVKATSRSPIDQSMARSAGFGARRPVRL